MSKDKEEMLTKIDKDGGIKRNQIELQKAFELRLKGLTYEDIGKYFGVSKQAAHGALKVFGDDLPKLKTYQNYKAEICELASMKILDAVEKKELEGEKISSLSTAFKNFNDAGRMERGQSTQNIAIKVVDLSRFKPKEIDD